MEKTLLNLVFFFNLQVFINKANDFVVNKIAFFVLYNKVKKMLLQLNLKFATQFNFLSVLFIDGLTSQKLPFLKFSKTIYCAKNYQLGGFLFNKILINKVQY